LHQVPVNPGEHSRILGLMLALTVSTKNCFIALLDLTVLMKNDSIESGAKTPFAGGLVTGASLAISKSNS